MRERLSHKDGEKLERARAFHLQGQHPQARALYDKLLRKYPRSGTVKSLLGALLVDGGELEQAIPLLHDAAHRQKDNADVHYNLGLALAETGQHAQAVDAYQQAVQLNPRHPKAHYNLGLSLRRLGQEHDAVQALTQDYLLKPSFDTCRLLARSYIVLENFEQALVYARHCVELEGATPEDLDTLVFLLCRDYALLPRISQHQIDELIALAAHATELSPNAVRALVNHGRACSQVGYFDQALQPLGTAVQLDPENESAHALYAVALLTEAQLYQGWHERTLLHRMHKTVTDTGVPRWQGKLTPGLRLWITREQGIGDQILYARMLQDLIDAGVDVTLVCEDRIGSLLQRSFPQISTCTELSAQAQQQQDAFASLGELHLYLRPDLEHIPPAKAYLQPDPALVEKFQTRYRSAYPDQVIAGLSWLSHSDVNGASKSIPLDDLLPILTLPNYTFVCVQYGAGAQELAAHAERHGYSVHIDDDVDAVADLEAATAQLAAVDKLISVSNAAVHMAGAAGVATHVLLGQRPVWHWFSRPVAQRHDNEISPWYANVYLHRQTQLDSWAEPIASVAAWLREAD